MINIEVPLIVVDGHEYAVQTLDINLFVFVEVRAYGPTFESSNFHLEGLSKTQVHGALFVVA